MFTLDFVRVTNSAKDWRDEVTNDIAFPMVNIKQLKMEEGFSTTERYNPFMQSLMHKMVINVLANREHYDEKKMASWIKNIKGGDSHCDLCAQTPCVWVAQREAVIANDENEHGHTCTIVNKTIGVRLVTSTCFA
jgi:hypothetical protein